ncbi:DUF1127 domain-containing protein [Marivita sp. S0852]|uniref:DUF1127 domain-containing protein n=1 Tax=Marivita sp. S0852 TaxID=3373893 RepID=UPI0039829906
MAYQSNITSTSTQGVTEQVFAYFAELRSKAARRKIYRETLSELRALSSRELDDLGLNRSMLKRVAYQAAYEN